MRVWLEGEPDAGGLRARITQTLNLEEGVQVVTVAATTEAVYTAVKEWLETYIADRGI